MAPASTSHLMSPDALSTRNGANRLLTRTRTLALLYSGMDADLALVMSHTGLGDRTHVALLGRGGIRVVGREDGGGGADDGADAVVESLGGWLAYAVVQDGTLGCVGCGRGWCCGTCGGWWQRHLGVFLEVLPPMLLVVCIGGHGGEGKCTVVVVCLCADDGTSLTRLGEVDF
jgi:hypothetical protein